MTGWSVMLRGIRYRSGRSLVVILLAAFATLAAVLAPAYGRAAQQSVLTDALRAAPQAAIALTISAQSSAAGGAFNPAEQSVIEAKALADAQIAKTPGLASVVDRPVTGVEAETRVSDHAAILAWRLGACGQLRVTGECAIDAEQAVVSERSAAEAGIDVGDDITVGAKQLEVVGLYTPKDPASPYWGDSAYFAHAKGERLDAIFTGSEDDVRVGPVTAKVMYPVKPDAVRLDAMSALRSELGALRLGLDATELELSTALLSIADDVAKDQAELSRSVPLIAIPLLLLAFAALLLTVAAVTEERGPELALARLRGFPRSRAARFGLGETVWLVVLGAPIGLAAGLGLVELLARTMLAPGVHVEPRWPVLAAAGASLIFSCVAAWLATRQTFSRGVLTLLRRVPQRASKRSNVVEAIVATVAVVGLAAVLLRGSSPFALLAPAALALLAGLAAGRLLVMWARLQLAIAKGRGHVPGILAAAQLARRPGTARMVVVLTSAVALLAFAAASWDIAARARAQHASDTLGAATVYQVSAAHPQALIAAVGAADPSGHAMAVVRADEQYAQRNVELIGVQSDLLGTVALWRGKDAAWLERLGEQLRADAGKPATLRDNLTVRANATSVGATAMRLGAVISAPGQPPNVTWLGDLQPGRHDYTGRVCTGCRFAGLAIGSSGPARVTLAVDEVRSGAPIPLNGTWRAPEGSRVDIQQNTLTIDAPGDVTVSYLDTPARLPAVAAGNVPGGEFSLPAFADTPTDFAIVERADVLPRAGDYGLLFDLDLAVRSASAGAGLADAADLRYEVWAAGDAASGLAGKLADQGVRVWSTRTMANEVDHLGRRGPALGFRLYLLAGIAAAILGLGVVALSRRLGADERNAETAALRATGVRARALRRALRRERLVGLALPLAIGLATGVGSALLMLPDIPLVAAGVLAPLGDVLAIPQRLEVLPIAIAAALLVLVSGTMTVRRVR